MQRRRGAEIFFVVAEVEPELRPALRALPSLIPGVREQDGEFVRAYPLETPLLDEAYADLCRHVDEVVVRYQLMTRLWAVRALPPDSGIRRLKLMVQKAVAFSRRWPRAEVGQRWLALPRLPLLGMSLVAAVSTAVVLGGVDRVATPGPRAVLFLPARPVTASPPAEDALAPDQVVFARAGTPAVAVAGRVVDESTPVARLSIPKLGLRDAPIYERGLDAGGQMRIASGYALTHYVDSAALGTPGNAVLYGHNDIEGSIFRYLDRLQPGDQFSVAVEGRTLYYRIANRTIVTPDHTELLNPSPTARLTLFTCYPYWVDTHRVVLIAEPA